MCRQPLVFHPPPLHLRAAARNCRICVTVPAKNEAEHITEALEALRNQVDFEGIPVPRDRYEVVLLANNCSDATATVARRYARRHPEFALHVAAVNLPPEQAGVGMARKLMMDAAAERLPPHGIICTTDADSQVDRHWICATLRAFDGGARAVGGRIIVPRSNRTDYRKIYLQDVTYRMLQSRLESMIDPDPDDPWPRHFQQYGPSMAIRVDAYLDCGGMPALQSIEDVELGWALERVGVNFVHDPDVKVYTSDRRSDRVAGVAFSSALEEWSRMQDDGRKPVVFGLDHSIRLYKWKVALRRAHQKGRGSNLTALKGLCERLSLSPEELDGMVAASPTFGALYQEVRKRLAAIPAMSDATFEEAIRDLRRFTRSAPISAKRRSGNGRIVRPSGGQSSAVAE